MKKKILIFFDTLDIPPKTGTSYRFFYQSKWLHSYGYDIVVILCDRNGDAEKVIESLPYEFHILSPDKFYDVELISQISEEISPDIVQVITPQNVLKIGYPVSKKLQIPLIVEMHDIERDLFSKLKKPESELDEIEFTQYAAAQIADGIIVLTEYDKQRLLDYGIPESKIIVSPIGIDFRYFHYQLPSNNNEIVFLGNLYYEPNKRAVLRILKNILNQTENIKKFNIIGMAPDKLIEEFNRYEKVQYHGAVDDYRSIVHKSTLAVAPLKDQVLKLKCLVLPRSVSL